MQLDKLGLQQALLIGSLLITPFFSQGALASSSDECAIWMCLPTGFPSGCDGAKSAFKHRVKRHKSPLPSFSSCLQGSSASNNSDRFTSKDGVAAYIPSYKYCAKSQSVWKGKGEYESVCVDERVIPEQIIKGRACYHNRKERTSSPTNCAKTLRYTEVYRNGVQFGKTHYY